MVAKPKHVDTQIAVQQDESSQFSQSIQLCQKLIPYWASLSASDVEVLVTCTSKESNALQRLAS